MKSGARERRADNRARCPRSQLFSLGRFLLRKLERVRTFESKQGRGGVVQTIAHGVHVCGFARCDAFRPDGGVEARVLSAGSAHVAAGLFNPPTLRACVWVRMRDTCLSWWS